MSERAPRRLIVDLAWLAGAALFVSGIVGGSVRALDARRASIAGLRASLGEKERSVATGQAAAQEGAELVRLRALLDEADRMVASDSRRIDQLSRAAREAGVRLVLMRSSEGYDGSEAGVISRGQRLTVVGDHRGLAAFLDGIHGVDGVVGLDSVEIESEGTGVLRASLDVVWFGLSSDRGGV